MRPASCLPAILALVPVPASAEVVAAGDTGFVVTLTADTTADSAQTWKTLIAPAAWWSAAHTWSGDAANLYIDAQATGCFCEKLPVPAGAPGGTRIGSVEHAHIVFAEPGKMLRMSGAFGPLQSEALNATLTITLKPEGEGTRIVWDYVVGGYMRMKPEEIAPAVDKVLGEQLASLAARAGQGGAAK